jgi:cytochrome c-type biogenesis protein CcmF
MLADLGLLALSIAFLLGVYACAASIFGGIFNRPAWVESARAASIFVFPFLSISTLLVLYFLYKMDFSLAYVYNVSSVETSTFLRLTALWGGQQGSLLFWSWIMAGFVFVVMVRKWREDRELMPWVMAVSMLTTVFFIGVVLFITNPFARLWYVPGASNLITAVFQPVGSMAYIPQNGTGLNPLLRHFGMIGHPPTTYLGFTGFLIPYAYAIAALITGRSKGDEWIRTTRRWTLVAWIFLTIGLILGGRWAYDVLGWGGFWGWDPIENAMLLPWLTGTAFLHSVMMTEKRGMLKKWNMVLIILTYALTIFGTFITRTGIISSVHAFAQSALGPAFFVFMGVTFIGSLMILYWRWDTLKSEHHLESFLSRETAFVFQNMLFLAITFAVFWGTMFSLVSELFTGEVITVGPPYFIKTTGPLFFVLVLLMGVAPIFAWRKQAPGKFGRAVVVPLAISLILTTIWGYSHRMHPASFLGLWMTSFVLAAIAAEFWKGARARMNNRGENLPVALAKLISRSQRRYGGYFIHLGVVMIGLGVIGDAYFQEETQTNLRRGEVVAVRDYQLQFNGLRGYQGSDGREVVEATISLFKDYQFIRNITPRRDFFVVQEQPVTIPGIHSTVREDVYVLLLGWEEQGTLATLKIYINPMINWVWAGGIVMILGTLIAAWPSIQNQREVSYSLRTRSPKPVDAVAGD